MHSQSYIVGARIVLQLSNVILKAISRGGGHLIVEYNNEIVLIPHHLTARLFMGNRILGTFTKKADQDLGNGLTKKPMITFIADSIQPLDI